MTDPFDPTEWITTKEAAELTGYSDARFRQLAGSGAITAYKRGRDWFLNKRSVLEWANSMKRLGRQKRVPQRGQ
jgi:excisionase family DNA binding protein